MYSVKLVRMARKISGCFPDVRQKLSNLLGSLQLVVMDGCTVPMDLTEFQGVLIVAAPPSLYAKNIENAVFDTLYLTMPAVEEDDALAMAKMLGVDERVVLDNFSYMKGISRYLLEAGQAKKKVRQAVEAVSAPGL